MNWTGKIIGMLLGFFLAGPVGFIAGLIFGHIIFDQGWFRQWLQSVSSSCSSQTKVQEVFFNTTFRVMGFVAKSDGRVSENEIRQARHVMQQMGLDDNMKREAIRLFTEGKQPNFNLGVVLNQLGNTCLFQPTLLRMFLEIQIQMAYADGGWISEYKRQVLQYICERLEINGFQYYQFEQRFQAEQNYKRYHQKSPSNPHSHLNDAYKILGLTMSATNSEIKKTYRRLMSQHHPDKLMAKGLPPEMIKVATQKTQKIKNAYEQIRKASGMA
ncbi:co-chaperone DjlA [Candidatus Coxiella mudrowiae]|uniref:Co-chaperone protein DjlA n=1 Tax=Candidatus Coxiella mudrowiae TaxID=2054173 RepID=A0ABN4HP80_9COXI|nr:co-chaperone DjlA [Candidatus Coxiella mudrowiae]AKQ33179.1 DnaJ-like protein DjlA [Candidatus Coxiella mudrowiae]